MTTKTCTKCGETKDLEEFGKNKSQKDGKHFYCKACIKILRKKYSSTPKAKEKRHKYDKEKHIKYQNDDKRRKAILKRQREAYQNNPKYREAKLKQNNAYHREQWATNPEYRTAHYARRKNNQHYIEDQKERQSQQARKWLQTVVKRDDHCVVCNTKEKLQAHHLNGWPPSRTCDITQTTELLYAGTVT